jgi:iron complex transport system permease protein
MTRRHTDRIGAPAPTPEPAPASASGQPARRVPRRAATAGPVRLLLLLGATLTALVAAIAFGAAGLPLGDVLDALAGRGDPSTTAIVLQLRLPRALLAALAGGGLALSGAVFQAVLRNPLAEPYILGVSGGAAIGAVAAVVLGWGAHAPWAVPIAAFAGAVVSIVVVFRIAAGVGRRLDTRVLLLAGVMAGAFFNAIILLLLTFADVETFRSALFWIMGSLSGATWPAVLILAAYFVPAAALLIALARPLDLLALGEETALFLGARVERVKWAAFLVASLLVGVSVAVCGVIGFIGLIVPHAIRLAWGSGHRLLLPASVLAGAAFLLAADTVARTIAAPAELPVGVVTALVGVPVFLLLLTRS